MSEAGFDGPRAILLERILERVAAQGDAFEVARSPIGVEIRKGRPRILLFPADRDRIVAFFFKPSRLHFSRDRFSYGALYLYASRLDEALRDFESGLAFLAGDLRPALRPPRLKRSLDVTVPD